MLCVTQSRSKFTGIQKCLFFTLSYAEDCRNRYDGRSEWIGKKSEPLSVNGGVEEITNLSMEQNLC